MLSSYLLTSMRYLLSILLGSMTSEELGSTPRSSGVARGHGGHLSPSAGLEAHFLGQGPFLLVNLFKRKMWAIYNFGNLGVLSSVRGS